MLFKCLCLPQVGWRDGTETAWQVKRALFSNASIFHRKSLSDGGNNYVTSHKGYVTSPVSPRLCMCAQWQSIAVLYKHNDSPYDRKDSVTVPKAAWQVIRALCFLHGSIFHREDGVTLRKTAWQVINGEATFLLCSVGGGSLQTREFVGKQGMNSTGWTRALFPQQPLTDTRWVISVCTL